MDYLDDVDEDHQISSIQFKSERKSFRCRSQEPQTHADAHSAQVELHAETQYTIPMNPIGSPKMASLGHMLVNIKCHPLLRTTAMSTVDKNEVTPASHTSLRDSHSSAIQRRACKEVEGSPFTCWYLDSGLQNAAKRLGAANVLGLCSFLLLLAPSYPSKSKHKLTHALCCENISPGSRM